MKKTITKEWLAKNKACQKAVEWIDQQDTRDETVLIKRSIAIGDEHLDWVSWYLSRGLNRKNKIKYAVYSAEQVIGIYETKYPDDQRPRQAIEAAKAVIESDNEKTRQDAANAAHAGIKIKIINYGVKLLKKQRSDL